MILKNSARCNTCQQEIESKHRHDFVTCQCGNLSVDGGKDYLRRCYQGSYTETSISKEYCDTKADIKDLPVKNAEAWLYDPNNLKNQLTKLSVKTTEEDGLTTGEKNEDQV